MIAITKLITLILCILQKLLKLKNNLFIENLNLKIKDKKNDIINLKKISYENKKKIIIGKFNKKKFKIN